MFSRDAAAQEGEEAMTYVYFIANRRRGLIKIGTSEDPRTRLLSLSNGGIDSLHLVAVVPGDERYESALHERFEHLRVAGEWFRHQGDLEAFLSLLPSVDLEARPHRIRQRVKPSLSKEQKALITSQHADWLNEIRDAVYAIGISDFADAIGVDCGDVVRALNGNGRYFRFDWWLALRHLRSMPLGTQLVEEALKTP